MLDVARGVLAELDLDLVLDRVLRSAQELAQARYAALGVLNETKTELARFITRGIAPEAHDAIGALPRGRGVLGALIEDPVPLRLVNVGSHPRSYGFPQGHPHMETFLGVPILVNGAPFGNLYLTEKAGGERFSEDDEQAVALLAEFAGIAVDHARRYAGERERRADLARTVAALEATTQITRALGGETNPDVVLELVAKRGRALVSARTLLIELRQGEELVVAASAGEMPPGLVGRRMALETSLAAHAMRTQRVQRVERELNRARFDEHGLGSLGVHAEAGLVVPLIFRGSSHGVLIALDRVGESPSFSAEDERLLHAFATSAATAVATARSVVAERRAQRLAAAEAERHRWARELHDETLQSLSALRIGLSAAERSQQPELLARTVRSATEQLEESIASLRALITDLRPAALDELGVTAAIEALAERSARREIEVDVDVDLAYERGLQRTRLTPELEATLYRIVQEALTNASKHGGARRAVVEIHEEPTQVRLRVRDDGAGFDPTAETNGFGLLGMRERVDLHGGELAIDSAPGRGTEVRATLPAMRRGEPPASSAAQTLTG